eukprot:1353841-Amorphochlora_amoeboformis.AAC.2
MSAPLNRGKFSAISEFWRGLNGYNGTQVIGNVSPSCSPIAAEATSKFQMTDMASLRSLTSLPRIMLCKKREISGGEAIRTSSSGPNFRPKANLRAVFIEYVIDRSGSMLETGRVPLQQTLSLIREQREIALQTDTKIFLSVTTFNGRAKTHLDAVDLAETGEISEADVWKWLRPWGRTRLVDTALERLKAQDRHVRQYVTTKLKHIQQTHLLSTDPLNKSLFNSNNAALQLSRSRTMIEKRVLNANPDPNPNPNPDPKLGPNPNPNLTPGGATVCSDHGWFGYDVKGYRWRS